ncbi:porin, partial [Brucella tritici]
GTETCLRIHGYVRYDATGGDRVYARTPGDLDRDTWGKLARATLRFSTASETELGTLRTYTENRFNFTDGFQGGHTLNFAYIQLGGLRLGLDESAFHTFTGYLG